VHRPGLSDASESRLLIAVVMDNVSLRSIGISKCVQFRRELIHWVCELCLVVKDTLCEIRDARLKTNSTMYAG